MKHNATVHESELIPSYIDLYSESIEIENAIKDGYSTVFKFVEANVVVESDPSKVFPILGLSKTIHPCAITGHVVYRIETANIKGFAVNLWSDDETLH
jgi:hypothetical protein